MATESLAKIQSSAQLENGMDSSGNIKYVSLNLGADNKNYYTSNKSDFLSKLMTVAGLIEPVLDNVMDTVKIVATSTVSSS